MVVDLFPGFSIARWEQAARRCTVAHSFFARVARKSSPVGFIVLWTRRMRCRAARVRSADTFTVLSMRFMSRPIACTAPITRLIRHLIDFNPSLVAFIPWCLR